MCLKNEQMMSSRMFKFTGFKLASAPSSGNFSAHFWRTLRAYGTAAFKLNVMFFDNSYFYTKGTMDLKKIDKTTSKGTYMTSISIYRHVCGNPGCLLLGMLGQKNSVFCEKLFLSDKLEFLSILPVCKVSSFCDFLSSTLSKASGCS